jgi:cysteine-rich repeat protein
VGKRSFIASVALALLACGCQLDDSLVRCGDLLCPTGSVCMAGSCASGAQVVACDGLADGDECITPGLGIGLCIAGACRFSACGDHRIDPPEVCDDGNVAAGDGCSPDCRSDESCGNGVIDGITNEICDDGNRDDSDLCRNDCVVPACGDGITDAVLGEGCDLGSANSNAPDATCRPNCQLARCGDGITGVGEVCDDGNLTPGDGCTPDCLSNETCGNGVLDFFANEHCDDGNLRGRDGCSGCNVETLGWRSSTSINPTSRAIAAAVYDSARRRTVVFGGGNPLKNDTWEFNGSAWVQVQTPVAPPARWFHAMAYDSRRARVVMFGGDNGGVFGDTWEYDGASWRRIVTATEPPARGDQAMTYDMARGVVVMTGGYANGGGYLTDTWEYNGTDWMQVTTSNFVPEREGHRAIYDPIAGRVLVFGAWSRKVASRK